MQRGASGGESRQTFERSAKTGFAKPQVRQSETVKRRRVRRAGVDGLFELLDGLFIAPQRGERKTVELARLRHIRSLFQKSLKSVSGLIELSGAIMRDAEVEQDRRQLRREPER